MVAAIVLAPTTQAEEPPWAPAKTYSIEVGKSKVGELTLSLGSRKQQTDNPNTIAHGLLWYQYEVESLCAR